MNSLLELKDSKSFSSLSLPVVPRTNEDAERILRRGEKTKEVLFHVLICQLEESCKKHPEDENLEDTRQFLRSKSYKSFNPKSELVQLALEVDDYIESLVFNNKSKDILIGGDSDDEDIEDSGLLDSVVMEV